MIPMCRHLLFGLLAFAGTSGHFGLNVMLPVIARNLLESIQLLANVSRLLADKDGYAPIHHSAARGDNATILYLVEQGGDVMLVSRRGQTTADMANGPVQRVQPYPETVALLESLGSKNNNNCRSC